MACCGAGGKPAVPRNPGRQPIGRGAFFASVPSAFPLPVENSTRFGKGTSRDGLPQTFHGSFRREQVSELAAKETFKGFAGLQIGGAIRRGRGTRATCPVSHLPNFEVRHDSAILEEFASPVSRLLKGWFLRSRQEEAVCGKVFSFRNRRSPEAPILTGKWLQPSPPRNPGSTQVANFEVFPALIPG